MMQWDATNKVLTDYMGYPISRSDALAIREQVRLHLKKSAPDLAEIANQHLREQNPKHPPFTPEGFK